jgi:hypothetical protein
MKKYFPFFLLVIFFQSCVVNQAFVPSGYEPALLEKKNDTHVNLSILPFNLLIMNYNRALTDKIGLGLSGDGALGLFSFQAGSYYYKHTDKFMMELGGGFQFYKNDSKIADRAPGLLGNLLPASEYYTQNFNFAFYSPFFGGSFIYKFSDRFEAGFGVKAAINIAGDYKYYQRIDSYQGRQNATPLDEESYNGHLPPFFSLEPALHLYFVHEYTAFHFQLGYNYRAVTLTHYYSFNQSYSQYPVVNASADHPTINPITFSIGWVFYFSRQEHDIERGPRKRRGLPVHFIPSP